MTTARKTARRTVFERNKEEVLDLLVSGMSPTAIAERIGASKPALYVFMVRHKAELDAMRAQVQALARPFSIAEKVNRIAEYAETLDMVNGYIAEHGLEERSKRYDKEGNEVGETIRFNAPVVAQKRGLLRDVAEELGQLPRPEVNIDARSLTTFTIHFDSPAIGQLPASNITPPLTLESTEEPNEPAS